MLLSFTERIMICVPRPAHLILAVACVGLVLAASPFAHCQWTSATAQQMQSGQPTPQPSVSQTVPAQGRKFPRKSSISDYQDLFAKLSAEESNIHRAMNQGAGNSYVGKDYSAAIGITKDEMQTVLTITRAAHSRLRAIFVQEAPAWNKYIQKRGDDENAPAFDSRNFDAEREEIGREAIGELKQQLGQEAFDKLDAFVARGGLFAMNPVLPAKPDDGFSHSCPMMLTKGRDRFTQGRGYFEFFRGVGNWNRFNMRQTSEEDKQPINLPIDIYHPTEEERQAVIDIAIDANRQIRDIFKQHKMANPENNTEYPYPEQWPIIEESITKLRQALARPVPIDKQETYFTYLDMYVFTAYEDGINGSREDKEGRVVSVAIPTCAQHSPVPEADSVPAQTTGANHD
jgi:hypothetical protein